MSEHNNYENCSSDCNQEKIVMFDYQSVLKKAEQYDNHLQHTLLESEDLSNISLSLYDQVINEASAPEIPSFHNAKHHTSALEKQMKELQDTIDSIEAARGHKQKKIEDQEHQKRLKGQKEWKKMTQALAQEPDVNSIDYLIQEVERYKIKQQIQPKPQPKFAPPDKKTQTKRSVKGLSPDKDRSPEEIPAFFRYGNAYAIFHPFTDSDEARIHAIDHPYDRYLKQHGFLFSVAFCTSLAVGMVATVAVQVFSDHPSTQVAIAYLYNHTITLVIIIIMIIYITLSMHTGCYIASTHEVQWTKKHKIIGGFFHFSIGCIAELPFVVHALIKNNQE